MEDKKYLKIGLIVFALMAILIFIIILSFLYFGVGTKNTLNQKEAYSNINDDTDSLEDCKQCPYEKYKDLNLKWCFTKENTEFQIFYKEFSGKIIIENEIAYLEKNGDRKKLNSINENSKCLTSCIENNVNYLFILTDEGNIWKLGNEQESAEELIYLGREEEFKKIDLPAKAYNMTYGNDSQNTNTPYFLLETGELVDIEGENYK